ncbi:glycosyltransferase family 2 protein [Mycoplasmopsis cricetuli]|uniref:glycosyltransferase family 2 protein n=1 Tax=Mycoplasmopsis cricetuli TaxID=171283 RepID=UPI000470DAD6|nr:glycosyltransferase family 2 protein [Mycoplasmopsis cricetuli]
MRISLISLVGNSDHNIEWYLQDLVEQDTQDFEIILCINKNSQQKKIFEIISKYKKFFGSRLIVIFNTKNHSYEHNLISSFRLATGNYITILNSDTTVKRYYVKELIAVAVQNNVELLEYKPRLIGSIHWKPKARMKDFSDTEIAKNPKIYAYAFPFIFNKVFKNNLIKKFVNYVPKTKNGSKICLELTYMLLLNAKTYKYIDKRIVREFYGPYIWLNTTNGIQTFDEIEKYIKIHSLDISQEIQYAKYYYLKIVMLGLLTDTTFVYRNFKYKREIEQKRSDLLIDKHINYLKKIQDSSEYEIFKKANIYMLGHSVETNLLVQMLKTGKKYKKDKILSELE